jgi:hypothetical protein
MFARRARLYFKVLSIPTLGLLMVSLWLSHSPRVDAQTSHSSKVRELQEERLATLSKLVEVTAADVKTGEVSTDTLRSAGRARDEAELVLCTSDAERITVLEKIVAEAKAIEASDTKLVAEKAMAPRDLLKATADRLEQQIRLESVRTK